jgi:molybdopterin-guanine dinucleotide biosynthesis protein MobB
MKHTHHEINDRDEGDTSLMRQAGAHRVVLAGESEAIVFDVPARRVSFKDPQDLLAHFGDCDVVLIEGFRNVIAWPRVELASEGRRSVTDLVAILDRIWRS